MERYVMLSGFVCNDMARHAIEQIEKFSMESNDDIYVFICTYGGCVASMFSIVDAMDRSPCDIVTLVSSRAMSAGALISTCGTPGKRLAMPNAQIMFHEPNGMAEFTPGGLSVMEYYRTKGFETIASRLGKSYSEIENYCQRDFYIMPEQALEFGLIDGIVGADVGLV